MKAFITSHFSYCPLTWMFHSRNMEHHIRKIHEMVLKLVYDTPNLSSDELTYTKETFSYLPWLVTEIFKFKNEIGPELMNNIFQYVKKLYNLRNTSTFHRKRTKAA